MKSRLMAAALALAATHAAAEIVVTKAWVRGTVPGQQTTGAFLTLRSTEAAKLVVAAANQGSGVRMHYENK